MLDAFIIDRIKKKEQEREYEQWQPVPLPLQDLPVEDVPEKKDKKEKKPATEIRF
jgi:hypothetical protein